MPGGRGSALDTQSRNDYFAQLAKKPAPTPVAYVPPPQEVEEEERRTRRPDPIQFRPTAVPATGGWNINQAPRATAHAGTWMPPEMLARVTQPVPKPVIGSNKQGFADQGGMSWNNPAQAQTAQAARGGRGGDYVNYNYNKGAYLAGQQKPFTFGGRPVQDPYRDAWNEKAGMGEFAGSRVRYNNEPGLTTVMKQYGYVWNGAKWVRPGTGGSRRASSWYGYGGGGGGYYGSRSRLVNSPSVLWRI